jgi:hypothetical protein
LLEIEINMRKLITFFATLILLISITKNQSKAQISMGFSGLAGFPKGFIEKEITDIYGVGFHIKYHYKETFSFGINSGYLKFSGKPNTANASGILSNFSYNIIPITAGGELHFNNGKINPFASFSFGIYNVNAKASMSYNGNQLNIDVPLGTKIGYDIGGGLTYSASKRYIIFISGKYNNIIFDSNILMEWISIKAGIFINIEKRPTKSKYQPRKTY